MYVTFNNMGNTGVDVKTNVCNLTDAFALATVFFHLCFILFNSLMEYIVSFSVIVSTRYR